MTVQGVQSHSATLLRGRCLVWLPSFSVASEGPVTSQSTSTATMAVTVQGEAWRKDSVACETYGAQMGLLNHQVVAPTVKYVHVLRFRCTGQKTLLLVESCCLWFAGNYKAEAKKKTGRGFLADLKMVLIS